MSRNHGPLMSEITAAKFQLGELNNFILCHNPNAFKAEMIEKINNIIKLLGGDTN